MQLIISLNCYQEHGIIMSWLTGPSGVGVISCQWFRFFSDIADISRAVFSL